MKYYLDKLKNGIKVLSVPMPSLESATVTVWVKTGSRNEMEDVAGISHFLEHMVFKGSGKRPSSKEISEAVDSFGGEFNAATSKEWTNFYIKARCQSLDLVFDILSDMVLNPLLKEGEIKREKGVIVEEINMYEDTPLYNIGDVFEQVVFGKTNLGRDTIGYKKTVKKIGRNDFLRYIKSYYYPENILVSVAGGVERKEALALSRKYFGNFRNKNERRGGEDVFVSVQISPQLKIKRKKNEQAHLFLGFVGLKRGDKDKYVEALTSSVLGGGMSSRMFTEVRERRGLAYAVKVSLEHYRDAGVFATYAGVDPKNAQKAIEVMLDQYYGLAKRKLKINPKEFKKAKEYLKGQLALSLEDTREVSGFFALKELFGVRIETPEEIYKKIDKIKVEDIYRFAREVFTPQRLNLAVIGPFDDKKPFERLLV